MIEKINKNTEEEIVKLVYHFFEFVNQKVLETGSQISNSIMIMVDEELDFFRELMDNNKREFLKEIMKELDK